ncbi:TetR/AcrR family transcriptional regulator [Aureimonas phyllosphaerae]|uniref:AcrR family transcriptional regulator n=1 Tax=Aureimonas phyllosphaerae TaxID=1166078 RepID=A0A7W6BSM0_9HYPH|nr:TetR/AcrR family transcriptional regulator [Aureimonas phyllosphaerae]MBB3937283.1 AcrR family transcriptional regulator [Aureimonas phyllosphaerae]MBB3961290.1 AcrR family transcriptional regulator [Aureimonas phyllosphaerae]SFF41519.1 transcriptional regulator, TetR family [Aureimonas phyllosphaerae]
MAYHHGDARRALLTAAAAMLESEGAARLSLRSVAEAAGLSRQAPYNHFANKEAMLAELVGDGFAELSRRMEATAEAAPFDRLVAAADAYIAFGTGHPATFRLMFARELVDLRRYPEVQAKAAAALASLSSIVGRVVGADAVADATLVAWGLVHGYTQLCIEAGIEGPAARPDRARLFAHAVAGMGR